MLHPKIKVINLLAQGRVLSKHFYMYIESEEKVE